MEPHEGKHCSRRAKCPSSGQETPPTGHWDDHLDHPGRLENFMNLYALPLLRYKMIYFIL